MIFNGAQLLPLMLTILAPISFNGFITRPIGLELRELSPDKVDVKFCPDKIPANISRVANTSAASIPLVLDQLVKTGEIRLAGKQKIVLVGYGAGLAWGQMSFKL